MEERVRPRENRMLSSARQDGRSTSALLGLVAMPQPELRQLRPGKAAPRTLRRPAPSRCRGNSAMVKQGADIFKLAPARSLVNSLKALLKTQPSLPTTGSRDGT